MDGTGRVGASLHPHVTMQASGEAIGTASARELVIGASELRPFHIHRTSRHLLGSASTAEQLTCTASETPYRTIPADAEMGIVAADLTCAIALPGNG